MAIAIPYNKRRFLREMICKGIKLKIERVSSLHMFVQIISLHLNFAVAKGIYGFSQGWIGSIGQVWARLRT